MKYDQREPGDLPLTPEDVEQIVAILSKSPYRTLDIETGRYRLRLARSGEGWSQEWFAAEGEDQVAAPAPPEPGVIAPEPEEGLVAVRPPLPGTFYRAPEPGAAPFVTVGDRVAADTVVAIIETMKLMNPVHAGVAGTIMEIIPDNADAVDVHSVLMTVRPE